MYNALLNAILLISLVSLITLVQTSAAINCWQCYDCGSISLGAGVTCSSLSTSCFKNVLTIGSTTTVNRGCSIGTGNGCTTTGNQASCVCSNADLCNSATKLLSRDSVFMAFLTGAAGVIVAVRRQL